jgi:hypothetical protein
MAILDMIGTFDGEPMAGTARRVFDPSRDHGRVHYARITTDDLGALAFTAAALCGVTARRWVRAAVTTDDRTRCRACRIAWAESAGIAEVPS